MDIPPIKVIYISSFSRSGSTILDAILGNLPDTVGVGELMRLPINGWQNNEFCSCGKKCKSCDFWSRVCEKWQQETGRNPDAYAALQERFERFRRVPVLLTEKKARSDRFIEYERMSVELFRAIQAVSGKNIIVDSSKNPFRAMALSMMDDIDLRFIHLVRDRSAVVRSMSKPYKKDPGQGIEVDMPGDPKWKTSLLWHLVNVQISWVGKQLPQDKILKVSYEGLISSPAEQIEQIGAMVGENISDIKQRISEKKPFAIGHKIAGNRLRMEKEVTLKVKAKAE